MREGDGYALGLHAQSGATDEASYDRLSPLGLQQARWLGEHLAATGQGFDRVIAGGWRTLWPGHGPAVTEVGPFLEAYRAHRLDREAQVVATLASGPATVADLVPRLYGDVDRRLWPAASRSVRMAKGG